MFFSNGPGDPAATEGQVELLKDVLERGIPYFGICFGNQLFGRALGFGTFKLKYGHRGINQPVMDRTTGKVEVTAHNHGFAVDAPLDRSTTTPYGEVDRVPRVPERRRRGRARAARRGRCSQGVLACSTTRRQRPARTTRATCSTGSAT